MNCANCGHENRSGRKFCAECGAALALACAACSAPYEAGEKFCGECGAGLADAAPRPPVTAGKESARPAPDADARKVVTIVFADLVGSTGLHERLDAESARRVMERYYAALRRVVDLHGGAVVKLLGDGVMAAFGLKQVAEDDALRAVRAAATMQDAFRVLVSSEVVALGGAGLRVGVNTGEVVVSGARDDVIGDPVNVAARLQEQGRDGDVVIGEATRRLVATRVTLAPLGSITLKGRAEAVAAYRLVSLEPPAGATAAPFVGREAELAQLETVYAAAVATPATRLAVLLGSPGLGKSRLIDELTRRHADDATILTAHCDATGGATFAPLAQALRGFLGLDDGAVGEPVRAAVVAALPSGDDTERTRIASGIDGLLTGAATSPEETFFVVRRFLAGLASAQPLVLVIDDLHWAEPLLLDLVEHLVQWGSGVPLFVLIGARPELRDVRSTLVTQGSVVADVVTLGGLDAGAAMRLAANVIGAADLPAAVAAKVLATSEGNPLFVGELVRMLVQEGALTKEGERWIVGAGLASLEMPPTIHALLAARIERLGSEDRHVLERAAVVGRHFSRSAVAALIGRNGGNSNAREASDLDARLESLRRSELIERDTGWLLGEPVLRFHHVLIRDAAYRRLLKGTRAELHERLADWIEGRVGDAPEHDELVGWHLEQAHQHLRELGPLDAGAIVLGERAARRLAAAGRRALARDDVSLAASLLGRALERLTAEAPERADLVLDWCESLLAAGDVGPAADAIGALDRIAVDSPRLRAWHTCFAGQLTVLTAPDELHTAAERVGAAARDLAALEDAAGEAKAHFVHAQALARLGKIGACEAALDLALAAARRAGDRRRANAVLAGAPLAALWGPSPVTRASGRCLDVVRVLRITQGAPAVEAVALSCQGVLEALRGRTDAARRMLASSRTMVEELGIAHRLFETDVFAGRVDLLEGNAPAAERALRAGYEGLRSLGLGIDAARAAALLGRALLAQDRAAEAETLSHESELLAGDDLQAAIAWRGVRAEALARRGEPAAAIELAEAAVAIAASTDALLDHADARLALAAAMRVAGRRTEADAEERRAFELWEAKGATVLADHARQRDGVAVSSSASVEIHAAASPARRPVPENAATRAAAEFEAIAAARDFTALATFYADDAQCIDHPTGSTYDGDGMRRGMMRLLQSPDARLAYIPLAALGSSWALVRREMSASAAVSAHFDVGPYEIVDVAIFGTNEAGRIRHVEMFSLDRLGAALSGFYERYADGLPAGPERERAAAMARTVSADMTPTDVERLIAVLAPDVEHVDHRRISTWSARGPEAIGAHLHSLHDVATDIVFSVDEILRLTRDAMLLRRANRGTDRRSGGAYEREFLELTVTNGEGLCARVEWFDVDHEADALARFDALTADATPKPPVQRRVRPNAATRSAERFWAAIGARDDAAVGAVFAEDLSVVHHPTRATYGRREMLAAWRSMMKAGRLDFHSEILAALGDTLVLERHTLGLEGFTEAHLAEFGRSDFDEVVVIETDEHGRWCHCEIFAADRLRHAIRRFKELYAESLPEGPARRRASVIARVDAGSEELIDEDRAIQTLAPSFECVDHRTLGTWSAKDREGWRTHLQYQAELAAGFSVLDDDVLALELDVSVVRQTYFGTSLASGGSFENVVLMVTTFDADGLVARIELFEPDQEAEALACFDALTGGGAPASRRGVTVNATTHAAELFDAAFASGDLAPWIASLPAGIQVVDHPTESTYGRDGAIESYERLLRMQDPRVRHEPLGTLGDSLGLFRRHISAGGSTGGRFAVGAFDREEIVVFEAGTLIEIFAAYRLADAVVRIYERYAAQLPAGPARERATTTARAVAFILLPGEAPGGIEALYSPAYEDVDHRTVGYGKLSGLELGKLLQTTLNEVADDLRFRLDDVLVLEPRGLVRTTTSTGIWRDGGGTWERTVCTFNVFDAEGRVLRHETFEAEQVDDALRRFDALTASPAPQRRLQRRVRPNAAATTCAAIEAAFARRDLAAIDARLADPMQTIEHPTATTYGRAGQLESSSRMMRMPDLEFRLEVLATLGDSLCLLRRLVTASGTAGGRFDVGAFEIESIIVQEVDAAGRLTISEVFASDHLLQAIARLHARWAEILPDGLERTRAAGIARGLAAFEGPLDADRIVSGYDSSIVNVDYRSLGLWSFEGREAGRRQFRAQSELAADFSRRIDDILACAPDVIVTRETWFGINRATGGPFENVMLTVSVYGADGLITRSEELEPDQEAAALARFDALVGDSAQAPAPSEPPFPNVATRALVRLSACWHARDWDGFARMLSPDFRFDDRRSMSQVVLDREGYVVFARQLGDMASARQDSTGLATRGERLSLGRVHLTLADGDVGPSELEYLYLWEIDEHGLWVEAIAFDATELDAAYAELDARYAAGEGAADAEGVTTFIRGIASRDWDSVAALCAPTFTEYDHRRLAVLGTTRGGEAWVRNFRALVELAPDTRLRIDHIRRGLRGALSQIVWHGSRDGGRYEIPFVSVLESDDQGQCVRIDLYDPEQLDQARARFAALTAPAASPQPFANAATRFFDGLASTTARRDWQGLTDLCAPIMHFDDRRPLLRIELGREGFLEQHRTLFDVPNARWTPTTIATRGERLALVRLIFEGEVAGGGGPLEIDHRVVLTADDRGRAVAAVLFAPEDMEAAYAELDRRYEAGEAAALLVAPFAFARAFSARNWDALAALCAPTFVQYDHRPFAILGTTHGGGAWAQTLRALVELAPDTRVRLDHVRHHGRGFLLQMEWQGTRDGGPYEIPVTVVIAVDEHGKLVRDDLYDHAQLAEIRARFAELAAPAAPLELFANAIRATVDAANLCLMAHDEEGLARLFAEGFHYSDRRRLVQLELDLEQFLAFTRELRAGRAVRIDSRVLATRGERLALGRSTAEVTDADVGLSEILSFIVFEVDERGRFIWWVRFDPEDLAAAYAELDARWHAGAAADSRAVAYHVAFGRALADRDWDALAALHAPALVARDHRLVGWDTLTGPVAFVGSLRAMIDLAPDAQGRLDHVRTAARGSIAELLWVGTRDGGAFESPFVWVVELDADGKACRLDFYDPHHLDAARARFAEIELTAPLPPPTALASSAALPADPFAAAFNARDWEAMRASFAADLIWEDRRRLLQMTGGVDLLIASLRERAGAGFRVERRLLGTAGDRIHIYRGLYVGGPDDGRVEIEYVTTVEADEAGCAKATIVFDPDDLLAAQREAYARWTAIDPAAPAGLSVFLDSVEAFNAHDRARCLAAIAADLVVDDHRRTGIGRIEGGDAYVESLAALWELAPNQRVESGLVWHASARRGGVTALRRIGTLPEGGEFESDYLMLFTTARGRVSRLEYFEPEAVDAALARFEELRPASPRTQQRG